MKTIIGGGFNVIVAAVHPVDSFGVNVQSDPRGPAQLGSDDAVSVCPVHVGSL